MMHPPATEHPARPQAQAVREHIAHTRLELLRHMGQTRGQPRPQDAAPPQDRPMPAGGAGTHAWTAAPPGHSADGGTGSLWDGLREGASLWWQTHPARLALELGQPLLERYAQAHPMKLLALGAGTGAVLVLARPWRLISVTGLLVATLKSAHRSALASAVRPP